MFYKIIRYISKYSLMLLVYMLILALVFKVFGTSYVALILTTSIYIFLLNKKILTFSSSWLEKCNNLTSKN